MARQPPKDPPQFVDVKALAVDVFGGVNEMHQALQEAGYSIGRRALDKWVDRSRIAGDWWPRLFHAARFQGTRLDPSNYLKRRPPRLPSPSEANEYPRYADPMADPAGQSFLA